MPTEYDLRTRDRHIRRDGDDYGQELLTFLPQGQAWPREPGSTLVNTLTGLAFTYGFVDGRAADLLERDSDPRLTTDVEWSAGWPQPNSPARPDGLLDEWEQAWGLPDPCFPKATTIAERQRMLVLYMTWLGGQSRAYFKSLMEYIGYELHGDLIDEQFGEFAPFMAGISQCGDTRSTKQIKHDDGSFTYEPYGQYRWYIGPPEQRFSWFVNAGTPTLTWFRAASGQAGVDPHLRIGIPQDMQCLLNRWKPAHTFLAMDFSKLAFGDPMAGTP